MPTPIRLFLVASDKAQRISFTAWVRVMRLPSPPNRIPASRLGCTMRPGRALPWRRQGGAQAFSSEFPRRRRARCAAASRSRSPPHRESVIEVQRRLTSAAYLSAAGDARPSGGQTMTPSASGMRRFRNNRENMASRAGGSHPHALPEPYVTLSSHTAPDVRPFACRKRQ
jgi:hypothetical protein